MTLIGYMRVSTKTQDTQLQEDALRAAGVQECDLYRDVLSGKTVTRDGLASCLARLQTGDTLVVWRLDRLGRSLKHLVELVEGFTSRGVKFRSLMDPIDTTSASGELVFHIFCAMAQFERRLCQERISAGIAAKMAAGRPYWGRPPARDYTRDQVLTLVSDGYTQKQVAERLGVSTATVSRACRRAA